MKGVIKHIIGIALLIVMVVTANYYHNISFDAISESVSPSEETSAGEVYAISNPNSIYVAVENSFAAQTLTNISKIPVKDGFDKIAENPYPTLIPGHNNPRENISGKPISPDPQNTYLLIKNLRI